MYITVVCSQEFRNEVNQDHNHYEQTIAPTDEEKQTEKKHKHFNTLQIYFLSQVQRTLVITTVFVTKDFAVKSNLLL